MTSGLKALTHAEMTAKIFTYSEYINFAPEQIHETYIKFGMPEWQADGLKEDFAHYRREEVAKIADGVEKAIGKKPLLSMNSPAISQIFFLERN